MGRSTLACIRKPLLFLLISIAAWSAEAQDMRRAEDGLPLFTTFPQKTHNGGSQVFAATQDPAGILYFGSLRGVLSYDGAWWRTLTLPNDSAVFSIAAGRGPEIAVGAIGEFGWVARDAHGTLSYRSLVPQLPAEFREVGEVRSICTSGSGFLFVTERALVAWNGGAPSIAMDFRNMTNPPRACSGAYLYGANGIQRLDTKAAAFQGKTIERVIPYDATRVLVAIRGEGLHLTDGMQSAPFAPEASAWLRDKIVVGGHRSGDRIVVGTRQDGLLILSPSGAIEHRLDTSAGLPGDVLTDILTDSDGAVWLSYYGPVVRLDLASPVALLDSRSNMHGNTTSVHRAGTNVYVTTSHGLFVLGNTSEPARLIAGIPAPAWTTLAIDGGVLVGTGDGLFLIRGDGAPQRVDGTEGMVIYELLPSKRDPSLIWMGAKKGLAMLRRDGDRWRLDGSITGPTYVRSLVERDGVLWCGTIFSGVLRVDMRDGRPRLQTFSAGEKNVIEVGGKIGITHDGIVEVVDANGRVVADPRLRHLRGNYFHVAEDARGNLWTNATPPQFVEKRADGTYGDPIPLAAIGAANIQFVQADPDGTIWFGGDDGLYRYDSNSPTVRLPQPRPLVQRVVTADGNVVTAPLPHSFGRLRIEFAPISYQAGVHYQYRLGTTDAWSEWTAQPFIDYTNLDPGEHLFQVRARSAAGAVSPEGTWRFSVLPPWYRTRAAMILWIVVAAALIALIVRLRTAALRRQADRLRTLVAERTEELQQANAHLERLALLDELTGIANRRYFQRALVEDWRTAHEERQPLALVLLDLDHFKQLNDRLGHPAGDAALVETARLLSRHIRRSGEVPERMSDIVARIGGEEFAVLLSKTTEDEALLAAERLRAGIAAMQLGGDEPLTASCGVASIVPNAPEGWDALVQRADRALYAAKAAGRNCVRGAREADDATSLAV